MKKLLIGLLLIISVVANAATYYISTTGTDGAGVAGGIATPWRTLSYACTRAITVGDIIHVNAGTYTETVQSVLRVGVSIEGVGVTSNIISHVGGTSFTIYANSGAAATDGNQHISGIKLDGDNLTAYGAIRIGYRKNVGIYNCTIINFNYYGVSFINGEPPSTYATGNTFHDNIVTNCSIYASGNRGCLEIQGQDGILIYNNNMSATRGSSDTGDVIYAVEGFLKNVKIYNNTLVKTHVPGVSHWDFAIELWNILGGVEIYNNIITGSVDLVNCVKGTSTYSVWVHDNIIGQPTLGASEPRRGILLETAGAGTPLKQNMQDVIIERNYIHDVTVGIYNDQLSGGCNSSNIYIRYNIIYNIGMVGVSSKGWGIYFTNEGVWGNTIDNYFIWNNVIIAYNGTGSTMWGIHVPDVGTVTDVSIRNNIVSNWDYGPTYASASGKTGITIDRLSIENNIFYNNGNSNVPRYASLTPTNNTTQNNIISNPLFDGATDFHIQVTSPASNAGLDLDLTLDYDSVAVHATTPDIGAYEYVAKGGGSEVAPTVTTTAITAVSSTRAMSGGNVTDNGGAAVTARGVCWRASANPTVADSKTTDGSGTGTFSSSITSLVKNTTYHVRAYATNSVGTSYGADIQFTTPNYVIVVW